ncbi:MAG: ATP-binding protein, partial [Comamonas sp.]
DLPLLHIDAVLMERVLVNLLDNAAKYTPPGTPITVAARLDGADCLVTVQDAGPGLPAHVEPVQLFEPFTRGETESAVSGMGLGLTLAQRIVKVHGGSLQAETLEPGPGTVFTIRLPVPDQPAIDE